jgi:hypothetical protein
MTRQTPMLVALLGLVVCGCSGSDGPGPNVDVSPGTDGAQDLSVGGDGISADLYSYYPTGCEIRGKYSFERLQMVAGDCPPGGSWYDQIEIQPQASGYRVTAEHPPLHSMEIDATLVSTSPCRLTGSGKDLSASGDEDWDVSIDWTFKPFVDAAGNPDGYGFRGTFTLAGSCTITYECQGKWWGS